MFVWPVEGTFPKSGLPCWNVIKNEDWVSFGTPFSWSCLESNQPCKISMSILPFYVFHSMYFTVSGDLKLHLKHTEKRWHQQTNMTIHAGGLMVMDHCLIPNPRNTQKTHTLPQHIISQPFVCVCVNICLCGCVCVWQWWGIYRDWLGGGWLEACFPVIW